MRTKQSFYQECFDCHLQKNSGISWYLAEKPLARDVLKEKRPALAGRFSTKLTTMTGNRPVVQKQSGKCKITQLIGTLTADSGTLFKLAAVVILAQFGTLLTNSNAE
jgi:hypothetical protein